MQITQEIAQKIIDEFCEGSSTYQLGEKYNLWQTSICNIIAARSWKQCARPENINELIETRRQKGRFKAGRKCHIDAPPFTTEQEDIIIGSLLGDAHLRIGRKNCSFSKKQKKDRLPYLEWMEKILSPYSSAISPIYSSEKLIGGKKGVILERQKIAKRLSGFFLNTHQHPNWTILREEWYKDKIKIVPTNLKLNPLRIAVWYWDDGSNSEKNRTAVFCVQSFTMDEAIFLAERLHDFEIKPEVRHVVSEYTGKKMPILKIYSKSYDNLIELVKPYMFWDCFAHKIKWRPALNNNTRKPMSEWKNSPSKLSEKQVLEILAMKHNYSQQQIADQFQIQQTTVSAILRGKTWRHLSDKR